MEIKTDSATEASGIKSEVSEYKRIKIKRAAEMLIKRRLGVLGDLIREFGFVAEDEKQGGPANQREEGLIKEERHGSDVLRRRGPEGPA